jgi:hypothetical protein
LEVAAHDVGDLAPGDFVRTVKEVADLVGQISIVSTDRATAAAAADVLPQLVRGVVAAGGLVGSAPLRAARS